MMRINQISYTNTFLFNKTKQKRNNTFSFDTFKKQQTNNSNSNSKSLKFYFPSFGQIIFKDVSSKYEDKKEQLEKELDIFSGSKKNAQFLGSGISAEAYILKKMPEVVVKQAFDKKETFEDEQKNMNLMPSGLDNAQKFVARAYDDEENRYYLLSTKIEGKCADPQTMPWTRKHLKSLFDGLLKLDKSGVYHGDLNNGNMKLTNEGNVNFLDFQWTHKISDSYAFEEKEESILPGFIYLENAQMFEMAELPYYLRNINDTSQAKQFFKEYLQEKSDYHRNRYDYINANYFINYSDVVKAKKFEKAQAVVFENPSEDVIKTEAKKVQFLNAFREAYKRIDKNVKDKNILTAGSYYLLAMNMVQDFRHEVQKNTKAIPLEKEAIEREERTIESEQKEISERENSVFGRLIHGKKDDERKKELENRTEYLNKRKDYLTHKEDYLDLSEEYGKFWFEKLSTWAPDAFDFPMRHITGYLKSWEKQRHDFNNPNVNLNDFGNVTNVLSSIGVETSFDNIKNFNIDMEQFNRNEEKNKELFRKLTTSVTKSNFAEIKNKIYEIKDLQKEINKAGETGEWLNALNLSMLMTLKSRDLYAAATNSNTKDYEYLQNIKTLASEFKETYKNIAQNLFQQIYREINNYDCKSGYVLGYGNMEKFSE